jgi:O-antigen ligase
MTEVTSNGVIRTFDRTRLLKVADVLAVAVALSLPWSTSATSLLVVLWLLALIPTLTVADLRRAVTDPAGGLPVLLWAFGVIGMLWSDAAFSEQTYAIKGFHKLLIIPLLLIQFRRSENGYWVLGAFLLSCTVLLAASWVLHVVPHPVWRTGPPGVPVKDYIIQSVEFLICAFACGHLAVDAWQRHRRLASAALAVLALLFLANMAFVATGRTSLVALPVLLILFGLQRFGVKGTLVMTIAGALFGAAIFASSSYLRDRALGVIGEIQRYHSNSARECSNREGVCNDVSAGYRLAFWKKSVVFVAEAPFLGHGTGSIPILFRQAAIGEVGIDSAVTGNPHNQTLEIAVQFGLLGVVVLYALWMAHFVMVGGKGLVGWLGQGLVLQTVVGSMFLSYLLDFSTGWLYALGIGVLGGMAAHGRGQRTAR